MEPIDISKRVIYSGKWTSDQYDGVNGTISVPLLPKSENQTYDTNAMITYDGGYKHGKRVKLPISVSKISEDVFFTGYIGDQEIEYKIDSYDEEEITGTYTSHNPSDRGNLYITKTENKTIDYTEKPGDSCAIM